MSNAVLPLDLLPGLTFNVTKTPTWSTRTQRANSGRQLTLFNYANPIWNFTLIFSYLRDRWPTELLPDPINEQRLLMDFVNSRQGGYDTFLYDDPDDNSVAEEIIGTSDGITPTFQLVRRLYPDGFAESVIAPHDIDEIRVDGVLAGDYTVDTTTGIITFGSALSGGAVVTATYSYYFRCRFMQDAVEFEKFANKYWLVKQLRFESILL